MWTWDAIVIPGGGVREGGLLPPWVQRRLDRALELYREDMGEAGYIITLSAGTTHRPPPVDSNGFPVFESVAMARYLIDQGIPAERILTETHSYDTIGNAFFLRVIHADPRALKTMLVVTSEFHMPRTRAIFDWMFGLTPKSLNYQFEYESVSDAGMPADVLAQRQQKEETSLDGFLRMKNEIRTLKECHQWLFTRHAAYRAGASFGPAAAIDPTTLKSY